MTLPKLSLEALAVLTASGLGAVTTLPTSMKSAIGATTTTPTPLEELSCQAFADPTVPNHFAETVLSIPNGVM